MAAAARFRVSLAFSLSSSERPRNAPLERLSETAVVRLTPNSRGGLLERPSFG